MILLVKLYSTTLKRDVYFTKQDYDFHEKHDENRYVSQHTKFLSTECKKLTSYTDRKNFFEVSNPNCESKINFFCFIILGILLMN